MPQRTVVTDLLMYKGQSYEKGSTVFLDDDTAKAMDDTGHTKAGDLTEEEAADPASPSDPAIVESPASQQRARNQQQGKRA